MRQLPKWVVREDGEAVNLPASATAPDGPGELTERRERHLVELSGHAIRQDNSFVKLAVTDLSYDGCGVECGVELRTGELVKLFVANCSGINAQVRWCSAGRAGLVFDAVSHPSKGKQPRQSERNLTVGQVTVRRCGGDRCYARVFDASPQGCQVEIAAELDERLWVRFEGLEPLEAQVCWVGRSKAGVRFATPIHPAVFDLLLQRLDPRP